MSNASHSAPTMQLVGKRLILTAPPDRNLQRLQTRFIEAGGEISHVPLIAIHPLPLDEAALSAAMCDWLFFTSKNGVHGFFQSPGSEAFKTLPVAVVGPATAQIVQEYGIQPAFISPRFDAESAAHAFATTLTMQGLRILWPCGNRANQNLATHLMEKGASVLECPVYETRLLTDDALSIEAKECLLSTSRSDILSFTSPSAVFAYECLFPGVLQGSVVTIASLGPKTSEALQECGVSPAIVPQQSTFDALFDAILFHFNERPA